jgi:hypothetical protein
MAKRYAIIGDQGVGTDVTLATLTGTTGVRPSIYDLTIGCSAAPGDTATRFLVQRHTDPGTSTAITPRPLDPNDPASVCSAGSNHTVEPTYTANVILLDINVNQRATYRWVAAPGGELKIPATASNGLGLKSSASTGTAEHRTTLHFDE